MNSFEAFIFTYSRQTVVRITTENREGEGLTPQEELQLDVFCYGICYMYRKWIEGKYELSADEAADAVLRAPNTGRIAGRVLTGGMAMYNDFDSAPLASKDFTDFDVHENYIALRLPPCSVLALTIA